MAMLWRIFARLASAGSGAAILAATVAVEDESEDGPTDLKGLLDGVDDESGAQVSCRHPADGRAE